MARAGFGSLGFLAECVPYTESSQSILIVPSEIQISKVVNELVFFADLE